MDPATVANPNPSENWFRRLAARPDAPTRLFFFPHAGGGASVFRPWGAALSHDIAAYVLQLPGREDRIFETPLDNMPEVLDQLAVRILALLDRPFAFFGHSMGSMICWELARRLRRDHGLTPRHLFVSGCGALHHRQSDGVHRHELSDPDLVDELRHMNGTPELVLKNHELMEYVLPTCRADFALVENYRYVDGISLCCPASALGGDRDESVTARQLAGWAELTSGPVEVRMFAGDHFFIDDNRDEVVRIINQKLAH